MVRLQLVTSVLAALAVLCTSMPGKPGRRESTTVNCAEQKERARHGDQVCCEEDGIEFCPVQCDAKMCHCVDTATGLKLNKMKHMIADRNDINCTTELQCPEFTCDRICDHGYKLDRNDCPMCMCNPRPPPQRCDTIKMLEMEGCNCNCVTEPEKVAGPGPKHMREMMCPTCNNTCNEDSPESCSKECDDDETLQSVGAHGKEMCVTNLEAEQPCTPEDEEEEETGPGPKVKGPAKRGRVGMIKQAVTPCMSGHVCQQVGINIETGRKESKCKMENDTSVCVMARDGDPSIECDSRGKFKPVQCRPISEETGPTVSTNTTSSNDGPMKSRRKSKEMFPQMCRCVTTDDGSTLEGTERIVDMGEKKPSCKNVYKDCKVPGLNSRSKKFKVPHGGEYFDKDNCRTCQCIDGDKDAICSDSGNCTVLTADTAEPANCTLDDGRVIPHDGTLEVGCEVCGCKNGRMKCTKPRDCKNRGDDGDSCDMCRRRPPSPVCGPDGRNHLSQCTAVECAKLAAVDLEDGPCQSQDVCERHPCKDNQICIRNGGVACMGKRGCRPHQLRRCVRIDDLKCPTDNGTTTSVDPEDQVCGDDGMTYDSLCHLIQSTTNINVAHSGPCDDPECQGGEVCGSDGVTYPNVCVLESQATTRVDYPGACETGGQSAEEICSTVINDGRCEVTADNCMRPVFPQDGCCPICGGVVSAVIDQDALTDASETNPDIQSADTFTLELLEAGVFQGLESKCIVEVSLTDREDLQLTLTAVSDMYSEFCNSKSEEIVRFINTRETTETETTATTQETVIALPQVFDFVMAAGSSPVIQLQQVGDGETTDTIATVAATTSGSVRLGGGAGFSVSLLVLVIMMVVFFY